MKFDAFLKFGVEQGASDLHLQAGAMPMLRIGRFLRGVEGMSPTAEQLREFLQTLAPQELANLDQAMRDGMVFVHEVPGLARFRCQLSSQFGEPTATLRVIPAKVPTIEELKLPPVLAELAQSRRGLVLIAGEAGSGRTTTLASLLDRINQTAVCKIVTIEDTVEHRLTSRKSLITQHAVGVDVATHADGMARAGREDPDVVAVDELSGPDSVRRVLQLAEGGRAVLAVIEGATAVQAIERLLMMVPSGEGKAATRQLAASLDAVVAQRMAATREGQKRVVVEVLRGGPMTARSLTEGRFGDLAMYLSGRQGGNQSFDQHVVELYKQGLLSGTEAMRVSTTPEAVAVELRAGQSK